MDDRCDAGRAEPSTAAAVLVRRRAGIIASDWRSSCPIGSHVDATRVVAVVIEALDRCGGSRRDGHVHHGLADLFAAAADDLEPLDPGAITCLREVIRRQVLLGLPPHEALAALHCTSAVLDDLVRQLADWTAARLEALAYLDGLTGLANRRAADDGVRAALASASRHARPLAAVVIDLDHLKQTNDRLGHEAGDSALRRLADALRSALREEDLAYRTGGDEFLVLMPDTDLGAVDAAMRRVVEAGAPAFTYGAAIGPHEAEDEDGLLRLADQRLFATRRRERGLDVERPVPAPGRGRIGFVGLGAVALSMLLAAHLTDPGVDARPRITLLAGTLAAVMSAAVVQGRRRANGTLVAAVGSSMIGFAAAAGALVVAQAAFGPHDGQRGRLAPTTTMSATSASAAWAQSLATTTPAPGQPRPRSTGGSTTGAAGAVAPATTAPGASEPWPLPGSEPTQPASTSTSTSTTTTTAAPATTTTTTTSPGPTTSSPPSPTTTTTSPPTTASEPDTAHGDAGDVTARPDRVRTSSKNVDIDVLANDEGGSSALDPSTLEIVVDPDVGRVKVVHGAVRYFGDGQSDARFRYRICNADGRWAEAWVTVTHVEAGADAP
jgi:diguanylate cyclase (GGDEF)-like protein